MFERIYDRWKTQARTAVRLFVLAAACAGAAAIALGFLCAAGFIYALGQFGPVYACLIAAGVFVVAMLVFLVGYGAVAAARRRKERERAAADTRSQSPLADPKLVMLGLQIAQAVGVRRLLPILALGVAAFALSAGRRQARGDGDRTSG